MVNSVPSIILGIDPGYDRFGWAVLSVTQGQVVLLNCGCVETDRKKSRLERYAQIQQTLKQLLDRYHPTKAGMEQLFFSKNVTTALAVAEIRGLTIACLLEYQVSIEEFNPGTIKSCVTGNGRADKTAMRKMVLLQLGNIPLALRQKVEQEIDDTIDAIGVALTAVRTPTSV
ncbi:crossover junction endodeoxyribonuclease RuvC [Patescibacteria group bacterium]|nr:crossover junction endodeoxyribonuclease RuvC [Patescibacteria group bacterium]